MNKVSLIFHRDTEMARLALPKFMYYLWCVRSKILLSYIERHFSKQKYVYTLTEGNTVIVWCETPSSSDELVEMINAPISEGLIKSYINSWECKTLLKHFKKYIKSRLKTIDDTFVSVLNTMGILVEVKQELIIGI
jgi:hypothetical protein